MFLKAPLGCLVTGAISLLLVACATYQTYVSEGFRRLEARDLDGFVRHFEKLASENKETRDELPYLLDYATALQIAGRYQESSKQFIKADRLADQLDYISVTQVAEATLGAEERLAYKGESYEKIMINGMNALNFLALGDIESAAVEVRRIDEKIKKFQRELREDYEFNPFATYLSGLIYEAQGLWDDAYLAYQRTFKLGVTTTLLLRDFKRAALKAKRTEQLKKEAFWDENLAKELVQSDCWLQRRCGAVVVIYASGLAPQKRPLPEDPQLPGLFRRKTKIKYLRTWVEASPVDQSKTNGNKVLALPAAAIPDSLQSELIYDVGGAAIKTLLADRAALKMRRMGAYIVKETVAAKVQEKNEGLGILLRLFMLLSDRADLRQWSLLPDTIHLTRIHLPPGRYNLKMQGLDHLQQEAEVLAEERQLPISAGKMVFKVIRSYQ